MLLPLRLNLQPQVTVFGGKGNLQPAVTVRPRDGRNKMRDKRKLLIKRLLLLG